MSQQTKSNIVFGGGFILLLVIIFFRDNIVTSDMYQRTIHREQWEQRQNDAKVLMDKLNAIDRQECIILIDAKRLTIPLEIERDTLIGFRRDEAEKIEAASFKLDEELCRKYGISPYNKSISTGE